MVPKIYKFDPRVNRLRNDKWGEYVYTTDYFETYTTGIENIVELNSSFFFETERFENERAEVVTYKLLDSEDLSDVLLALNNDVYWWDSPADYETKELAVRNKLEVLAMAKHKKVEELTEDEIMYYSMKFKQQLEEDGDIQKKVILPKYNEVNRAVRSIRDFLDRRKVR